MNFLKAHSGLFIGAIVLVVAVVGYSMFFAGGSSDDGLLVSENETNLGEGNEALLDTLLELRSLTLDESLFASPLFAGLRDFNIPIPPEVVGRPNPFAPLGVRTVESVGSQELEDLDALFDSLDEDLE